LVSSISFRNVNAAFKCGLNWTILTKVVVSVTVTAPPPMVVGMVTVVGLQVLGTVTVVVPVRMVLVVGMVVVVVLVVGMVMVVVLVVGMVMVVVLVFVMVFGEQDPLFPDVVVTVTLMSFGSVSSVFSFV